MARRDGSCNTSGGFVHGSVLHCGTQCATPLSHGQQGDRICRSHFLSRSEERAALILDTLDLESRPCVESSSHPRIPPPGPLPPPDGDQPTLTQIDGHNSDRHHIRSLRPPMKANHTGGQSKYNMLPPVPLPHETTPPALSRTSITSSGRRSIGSPVPLSDNAVPRRSSLLHPPPPPGALLCCPLPLVRITDKLEVLTLATCACRIVAGCGSICVPTTIYCPS